MTGSAAPGDQLLVSFTSREGLVNDWVDALCVDRDGQLWVGTHGGLSRYTGNSLACFTAAEGLPASGVEYLLEDDQGALWLGTSGGLGRCAEGSLRSGSESPASLRFASYTTREGLADDRVTCLLEDSGHAPRLRVCWRM